MTEVGEDSSYVSRYLRGVIWSDAARMHTDIRLKYESDGETTWINYDEGCFGNPQEFDFEFAGPMKRLVNWIDAASELSAGQKFYLIHKLLATMRSAYDSHHQIAWDHSEPVPASYVTLPSLNQPSWR